MAEAVLPVNNLLTFLLHFGELSQKISHGASQYRFVPLKLELIRKFDSLCD